MFAHDGAMKRGKGIEGEEYTYRYVRALFFGASSDIGWVKRLSDAFGYQTRGRMSD